MEPAWGELVLRNTGPSLGWALAALFGVWLVRAFLRGQIYSRAAVEDAQRREADWRQVAERHEARADTLAETVDVQARQIAELVEASRAILATLQGLQDAAGRMTG